MGDNPESRRSEADSDIEREIRQGRKVTVKDVMSRLAGPGAMKGASPVSPIQQAETEIANWLGANLADAGGSLKIVIQRQLKGGEILLANLDRPRLALAKFCRHLLTSDSLLAEIVREADVEWGRAMGERPHFDLEGAAPHPDDPYTIDGVRTALTDALQKLPDETC